MNLYLVTWKHKTDKDRKLSMAHVAASSFASVEEHKELEDPDYWELTKIELIEKHILVEGIDE